MASRKNRPSRPRANAGERTPKRIGQLAKQAAEKDAEISRLAGELADAQARLKEIEDRGTDAFMAQKIEALLAAAQFARGQAFDASLARNRAEGELRALEKAISEARGPAGWLLRRAARRVRPQIAQRRPPHSSAAGDA
jgi:predicted  nucleic acid-binding Zn-ribbon protein